MKANISGIFAFTTLLLLFSFINGNAQAIKTETFTGNWAINLAASEFNQAPHYTASRQIKVIQALDNLTVEFLMESTSGSDSTVNETLFLLINPWKSLGVTKEPEKLRHNLAKTGKYLPYLLLPVLQIIPEQNNIGLPKYGLFQS